MKRIVIVGSGLGGSYLASSLINHFEVIMVDICDIPPLLKDRLEDLGIPGMTYPTIESGQGGTTKAWHNALMEIDSEIFKQSWPFFKVDLLEYYEKAYSSLLGSTRSSILSKAKLLKYKLQGLGFSEKYLSQFMVIPKKRINAFFANKLDKKVQFYKGEVIGFDLSDNNNAITSVAVKLIDDSIVNITGDTFVLSAGGIGTPVLLQLLNKKLNVKSLSNAGKNYEDHLMSYVGEVELNKPLYKFWNLPIRLNRKKGNIRIPFSYYWNQIQVSIQLRPAYQLKVEKPREKVLSLITDIRNNPLKIKNYLGILSNLDDIIEILSFKFGLVVPTKKYTLLLVTQHPAIKSLAIWKDPDSNQIFRKWQIDDVFLDGLDNSIVNFINDLGDNVLNYRMFTNWKDNIYSGSHHSGTAKMGSEDANAVCDLNCKVFNVDNLYISDASLLPGTGFVNTGLTIVALSYRLGDYLKKQIVN
jgi:hypothetical protein